MPSAAVASIDVLPSGTSSPQFTHQRSGDDSPSTSNSHSRSHTPSFSSTSRGTEGGFFDRSSTHLTPSERRAAKEKQTAAELLLKSQQAVGGGKSITFSGGVAFLINNVTGGGMVLFPIVFQQAGWIVVICALLSIMTLVGTCGFMLIESMAMMPGNKRFQKRVEYTSITKYYLPQKLYWVSQFFFQMSLLCNNISMIIQSVQVMDYTLAELFGRSCALPEFYPNFFSFHCPAPVVGDLTVFGNSVYLLPLGWFLTIMIVLPLGFVNLDDNIFVQKGGFCAVISIVCIWSYLFIQQGIDLSLVPPVGSQFTQVLGVSIFNFAMITSIPSWVNEKKENVSIEKSFGTALPIAVAIFILLGFLGGTAFKFEHNQTILVVVYGLGTKLSKITFFLFPACVNLTSIPVYSIMQRYNLIESGVCGRKTALFLSSILPWLIAIPLYTGSGYELLVTWSGILITSVVNFIVPPVIYLLAIREVKQASERRKSVRMQSSLRKSGLCLPHSQVGGGGDGQSDGVSVLGKPSVSAFAQQHPPITPTSRRMSKIVMMAMDEKERDRDKEREKQKEKEKALDAINGVNITNDFPLSAQPIFTTVPSSLSSPNTPGGGISAVRRLRAASKSLVKSEREKEREAKRLTKEKEGVINNTIPSTTTKEPTPLTNTPLAAPPTSLGLASTRAHKLPGGAAGLKSHRAKKGGEKSSKHRWKEEHVPDEPELAVESVVELESPFTLPAGKIARAIWVLMLPLNVLWYYTIPHAAGLKRRAGIGVGVGEAQDMNGVVPAGNPSQRTPPLTRSQRISLVIWSTFSFTLTFFYLSLLCYLLMWCTTLFSIGIHLHPFLVSMFVLGVGTRVPSAVEEVRGYWKGVAAAGASSASNPSSSTPSTSTGDLNRIFQNNVFQILLCIPLPWLIYLIIHNGATVELYSGDIIVLFLTLFIMGALVVIVYRSYDWYGSKPILYPLVAMGVFYFVETWLLDYSVILHLNDDQCMSPDGDV